MNSQYVVYDVATGRIKRSGICQTIDIELQAQTGEGMVDVTDDPTWTGDGTAFQWDGTALVAKTVSAADQLAAAKTDKINSLTVAYKQALLAPVTYTTGAGATASFNQAPSDIDNLQKAITGSALSGTWSLNLWQDASGAVVAPFTYADLQGLAAAFEAADTPEYVHLLTLLAAVTAATTLAGVAAVSW